MMKRPSVVSPTKYLYQLPFKTAQDRSPETTIKAKAFRSAADELVDTSKEANTKFIDTQNHKLTIE